MAQAKFTMARGKTGLKDVVVAAGSAEAQSDTISINIDYTKITKGDAIIMIDGISAKISAGKWPPL
tara:strand:- start:26 stop:223 length:198 start_codon:yes stop_codon:yes gene_type:complete